MPRVESPPEFAVTAPVPPQPVVQKPVPVPVPVSRQLPSRSRHRRRPPQTPPQCRWQGLDQERGQVGRREHGGAGVGIGPGRRAGYRWRGRGRHRRPPEPRDMSFPFDTPPKELRGVSLSVTFWVRVDGRVERYRGRSPRSRTGNTPRSSTRSCAHFASRRPALPTERRWPEPSRFPSPCQVRAAPSELPPSAHRCTRAGRRRSSDRRFHAFEGL